MRSSRCLSFFKFLSTLSLRRATFYANNMRWHFKFLSTLSLRRATLRLYTGCAVGPDFYPRSPCGERLFSFFRVFSANGFLSTLSLRRATEPFPVRYACAEISIHALLAESDALLPVAYLCTGISIHALLAESDGSQARFCPASANFYPRSPCGERLFVRPVWRISIAISIHALLAESDQQFQQFRASFQGFLSTLSLRRATGQLSSS